MDPHPSRLGLPVLFAVFGVVVSGVMVAQPPGEIDPEVAPEVLPEETPIPTEEGAETATDELLPELREEGAGLPGGADPLGAGGSWLLDEEPATGQPDAFEDLLEEEPASAESGDVAIGGWAGSGGGFASGVVLSELLPLGFQAPLERQGFRFGASIQSSYDSNIFVDESNEEDDFVMTFSPTAQYRSAPAGVPGLVTATYTPYLRFYLENDDLNTIDHSADARISFTGTRGAFELGANYGHFTRSDRFVGGLVESDTISAHVAASYQVGSRTTIDASGRIHYSEESDQGRTTAVGRGNDNRTAQLQLSAYWQATSKTRFGPSVRYTEGSSGSTGDRQALAFLVVADHTRSQRLSFDTSLGLEQVESDFGRSDGKWDLTGSFGANYRPNDRLAVGVDLRYQAIPDGNSQVQRSGGGSQNLVGNLSLTYTPNPQWQFQTAAQLDTFPSSDQTGSSIGDQTYSASVRRLLPEGAISLQGSLGFSQYDTVRGGGATPGDEEFRSLAVRYDRPVMSGRGNLNASLQWSQSSGNRDWDRLQAALGLDIQF